MRIVNCYICGDWINLSQFVCDCCYTLLPWNISCCKYCALPLSPFYFFGNTCLNCCKKKPQVSVYAPFLLKYPVDNILYAYKYKGRADFGAFFANAMLDVFPEKDNIDMLIPVPLHFYRLFWRGYNQSYELAKIIARELRVPLHVNACRRIVNTKSQTNYSRIDRANNMSGVFEVCEDVSHKSILIIDDVFTTGATALELSSCFYNLGCRDVSVLVAARG
jgi:ComF family protein